MACTGRDGDCSLSKPSAAVSGLLSTQPKQESFRLRRKLILSQDSYPLNLEFLSVFAEDPSFLCRLLSGRDPGLSVRGMNAEFATPDSAKRLRASARRTSFLCELRVLARILFIRMSVAIISLLLRKRVLKTAVWGW